MDFVRLTNNPLRQGLATIDFGLAVSDQVDAKVYDVVGRVVRTLTQRRFTAGKHTLVWDGLDDHGHPAPRGAYFTRVRYRTRGFEEVKKLTVLK